MKLYALLFVSLSTLLFSCASDDAPGNILEENNFYALQVGNYWKYQWNKTDADGIPTEEWAIEEILVEQKGTIDGETFYKLKITTTDEDGNCAQCEEQPIVNRWVRDSLGYLIDSNHQILYSSEDTSPILTSENNWGDIYFQLQENQTEVEVPAGTFSCLNNLVYALTPEGEEFAGRDDHLFAPEVGWVKITCSAVSSDIQIAEKVLMEYQLQ